jgi:ParB/RepB/Spo0J family partition protein
MSTLKKVALKRGEIYHIDPRILKIREGFNPRDINSIESCEHIEELATSIASIGVKQPLTVYNEGGDIYVTDGHCRLSACLLAIERGAELVSVPCRPEEKYANDVDKAYAPAINNSGKPLNQLEQGRLFKRLLDLGQSESDIAKRTGKSIAHISNCLKLYAAPESVHTLVRNGEISPSLATQVVRGEGQEAPAILEAAVIEAKAQGRAKATAKHVEAVLTETPASEALSASNGPSPRSRLAACKKIVQEAIANIGTEDKGDGTSSLLISNEDLNELMELLEI